jgi:phosphoglucosamine mutase
MGRIFGTDGARGIANTELSCEISMQIGRATAMVLSKYLNVKSPKILIGMDTRASSQMLEGAITSGLCSVGADVLHIGVVPTPAVAYLVRKYSCDAGIMISASHNPCEYNGIKIFQSNGFKLPDSFENEIEEIILDNVVEIPKPTGGDVGGVSRKENTIDDYIMHLLSATDVNFNGYKVALDCANGSSSASAQKVFIRLGAEVIVINDKPDGVNINKNCGSTHLDALQKCVVENKCDLGFAFDGDADRMLAVDNTGKIVDGDKCVAICAKHMKENGELEKDTVVVTVMSNMGFFRFCEENNIKCEKTGVGDRYVLENMYENGYVIGGEQSGHIIFLKYATTGDGQLSAIRLLSVLKSTGKSLKELADEITDFPQVLVNVRVSNFGKAQFPKDTEVQNAIKQAEKELGNNGRILVRLSGTEPLVRVMLEGKDSDKIKELGESVAQVIKERLV